HTQQKKVAVIECDPRHKIQSELVLATNKTNYKNQLFLMLPEIQQHIHRIGWVLGRVLPLMSDDQFNQTVTDAIRSYYQKLETGIKENPFGVPYRPHIWGAGWIIQQFGVQQYYLHTGWPNIVSKEHMLNALNFILGCHPGQNTASFVSGIDSNSITVAYGVNRADWSYIPGGVVSRTAFIRPDFPELKEWPFLWQQTEYVIRGGASNFMFLVVTAMQLLEND
ncbi:MAG: glycoside hydrolase, partial [bacterium]